MALTRSIPSLSAHKAFLSCLFLVDSNVFTSCYFVIVLANLMDTEIRDSVGLWNLINNKLFTVNVYAG